MKTHDVTVAECSSFEISKAGLKKVSDDCDNELN